MLVAKKLFKSVIASHKNLFIPNHSYCSLSRNFVLSPMFILRGKKEVGHVVRIISSIPKPPLSVPLSRVASSTAYPTLRIETSVTHSKDQQVRVESIKRDYATYRAHTPRPETSSEESLKNNSAIALFRKKGSKVIQHTEIVESNCSSHDLFYPNKVKNIYYFKK